MIKAHKHNVTALGFGTIAKGILTFLLALAGEVVQAQTQRPYSLVCFERAGLTRSLAAVINAQQFLRNGSILRNKSCDFAQVPAGSRARFSEFYHNKNGFIFPLFRLTYSTTGQRMYSADGIFDVEHWHISRHCGHHSRGTSCLKPNHCDALDGFMAALGRPLPSYVVVPEACRVFIVE